MFSVMIVYLNRFWKIRICRKIWTHYIVKLRKHINIPVWVAPNTNKPVIVDKKMNTFSISILTSSSLMKSYKFRISIKVYRTYLRYSILSNSVKYPLLQVFIISCMPIIHISPTFMANARKQFLDDAQVFHGPYRTRTCDRSVMSRQLSPTELMVLMYFRSTFLQFAFHAPKASNNIFDSFLSFVLQLLLLTVF